MCVKRDTLARRSRPRCPLGKRGATGRAPETSPQPCAGGRLSRQPGRSGKRLTDAFVGGLQNCWFWREPPAVLIELSDCGGDLDSPPEDRYDKGLRSFRVAEQGSSNANGNSALDEHRAPMACGGRGSAWLKAPLPDSHVAPPNSGGQRGKAYGSHSGK